MVEDKTSFFEEKQNPFYEAKMVKLVAFRKSLPDYHLFVAFLTTHKFSLLGVSSFHRLFKIIAVLSLDEGFSHTLNCFSVPQCTEQFKTDTYLVKKRKS